MTLRQLKIGAIVIPIAAVVLLEVVSFALIGGLPLRQRLVLDAAAIAGIVVFATVIFRFIDDMQTRLRRQNQELLALHAAGLAISTDLSLASVLKKVVDQARFLLGARYGALSVFDRDGRIEQFLTSGVTAEEHAAIGPPPVGHGLLGLVLHEGQHLRLHDVSQHPKASGFPANHPVMRTLLAVPIPCRSPFLGNLYLSEKENRADFTSSDQETLERFAVQAGIAIDNAHFHAQAADLAIAHERLRIAHEMHDGLAQVLGYVNTKVQAVDAYVRRGAIDEASAQLRELAVSARSAYTDVREGIIGLRTLPGPEKNLSEVLREFLQQWKEQSGISADLSMDSDLRLKADVELQLVRIIQEALTNVRKHARATTARVELSSAGGKLLVSIFDDGVGFNPAQKSRGEFPRFGLSTMRERAESVGGTLTIESSPGNGAAVRLELPVNQQ